MCVSWSIAACFQGGREARSKNLRALNFGFDARDIDFVLLTHAHIDHSGLAAPAGRARVSRADLRHAGKHRLARSAFAGQRPISRRKNPNGQLRHQHRRGKSGVVVFNRRCTR